MAHRAEIDHEGGRAELVERAIDAALRAAASSGVSGKQLTPFLLARIAESTAQESLRSNRSLVLHNVSVAAAVALALSGAAAARPPGDEKADHRAAAGDGR